MNKVRVQALRQLMGSLSQKEFASQYGMEPSYISQILNGHRSFGEKAAAKMEQKMGLPQGTLSRQAIEHEQPPRPREPSAIMLGPISVWDDDTPLDDDEIYIPLLKEVKVSAGNGCTAEDFDSGKKIRMGKYSLRSQGVQFDQAVCVTVTGNSMEPALPDGSTVGIDRSKTEIRDGEVYVIRHGNELRAKAVYRLPGGGIRLRSYNTEEYPDEHYTPQQMQEQGIAVMGKVFWSARFW